MTRQEHRLSHKMIASALIGVMGGTPFVPTAALANETSALSSEGFSFEEHRSNSQAPVTAAAQKNAAKARTAPVTNTGAFTTSVPFDLPPGRLGMTPSLGLSYSSDAFRSDSPVGVGWSFGVPSISRDTQDGFPKTKVDPGVIDPGPYNRIYDDADAVFSGPSGRMVELDCASVPAECPPQATGAVYAPLREWSAVRFEYRPPAFGADDNLWIEHQPNGVKRYYGRLPAALVSSMSEADTNVRVYNELGTHTWLLLAEVDIDGNYIAYRYHHATRDPTDIVQPQKKPLLELVTWGGNTNTAQGPVFYASVVHGTYDGAISMMAGHVYLADGVDRVEVGEYATSTEYWTYDLDLQQSPYSGRLRLMGVDRRDPGGAILRSWTFDYSGASPSFLSSHDYTLEAGGALPSSAPPIYMRDAESDVSQNFFESTDQDKLISPEGRRSGHRFNDLNGDGRTDVVYHPAGIQSPTSQIDFNATFIRGGGAPVSFGYPGGVSPNGPYDVFSSPLLQGVDPKPLFARLFDIDGDRDLDALWLPVRQNDLVDGEPGELPPNELEHLCGMEDFWNLCGDVDPVPAYGSGGANAWPQATGLDVGQLNGTFIPGVIPHAGCLETVTQCMQGVVGPFVPVPWLPDQPLEDILGGDMPIGVIENHLSGGPPMSMAANPVLPGWPRGYTPGHTFVEKDGGLTGNYYEINVTSDVNLQMLDLNGDGRSEPMLTKYLERAALGVNFETVYVAPRAWKANDDATGFELDTGFTHSLIDNLGDWSNNPTVGLETTPVVGHDVGDEGRNFPVESNHNVMAMDVNSDGLVDLVVGRLPRAQPGDNADQEGVILRCGVGHDVFLNKGWRFELRSEIDSPVHSFAPTKPQSIATPVNWTSPHPLELLRNRAKPCMSDHVYVSFEPQYGAEGVMGQQALAQADLNGDGMTDMLFGDGFAQWLAEGRPRGWAMSQPTSPPLWAEGPIVIAGRPINGWGHDGDVVNRYAVADFSDQMRLVDMNNDGLADLVQSGGENPAPLPHGPPKVYLNRGEVPDLLTRVDTLGGSWTTVDYVASTSDEAATIGVVSNDGDLPAGMMLAHHIERSAGPETPGAGGRLYPVETIDLVYDTFVRDFATSETLGFTTVTATFENEIPVTSSGSWVGLQHGETVEVRRTYDTQVQVSAPGGFGFASSGVRFPLKAIEKEVEVVAGGMMSKATSQYAVWELDDDVARIRPLATVTEECDGSGSVGAFSCSGPTFYTRSETLAYGSFGSTTHTRSGDSLDGLTIVLDNTQLDDHTTPLDRTAVWNLSLSQRSTTEGLYLSTSFTPKYGVIRDVIRTFDADGRVTNETAPSLVPAGCAGPTDYSVDKFYTAEGLVDYTTGWQGLLENFYYDPLNLHVDHHKLSFRRFYNGQWVAVQEISEFYLPDLRTGEWSATTDANGFTSNRVLDSLGRTTELYGPGGVILEDTTYIDAYPARVSSVIYVDDLGNNRFGRRTRIDGHGNVLSVNEESNSVVYRRSWAAYDGFGRAVEEHEPAEVASVTDESPGSHVTTTTYDGHDRVTSVELPDGATTAIGHSPRSTSTVNSRGFRTISAFDWRGHLSELSRLDAGGGLSSETGFLRDGFGRILTVETYGAGGSDHQSRSLVRGRGGQPHLVVLPHAYNSPPGDPFEICHDPAGLVTGATTPEGRSTTVVRDALGRPVHAQYSDSIKTVDVYQNFDVGNNGVGRIGELYDSAGVTTYNYDEFGNIAALAYAPSPAITSVEPSVAGTYRAIMVSWPRGQVESAQLYGPSFVEDIDYTYDEFGRTRKIWSLSGGTLADAAFDAYDTLDWVAYGNQSVPSYFYEPDRHRLTDIVHTDNKSRKFAHLSYDWDGESNLTWERRIANSVTVAEKDHTYDELDRLERTIITDVSPQIDETYVHSPSGNLESAHNDNYYYGDDRNIQAVSEITTFGTLRRLKYDGDGLLTEDRVAGVAETYAAYDAQACLKETNSLQGGDVFKENHVCNASGSRVFRTTLKNGTTRESVLDVFGLMEVRPGDGVTRLRLQLGPSTRIEQAHSLSTGSLVSAESGYFHTDGRDSVVARTPWAWGGAATEEVEYGAWGGEISLGAALPDHRYLGHERDPGAGWYHYGPRTYSPSARRWARPDPLLLAAPGRNALQLNLYQYGGGNPTSLTDRNGLEADRMTYQEFEGATTPQGRAAMGATAGATLVIGGLVVGGIAVATAPVLVLGGLLALTAVTVKNDVDTPIPVPVPSPDAVVAAGESTAKAASDMVDAIEEGDAVEATTNSIKATLEVGKAVARVKKVKYTKPTVTSRKATKNEVRAAKSAMKSKKGERQAKAKKQKREKDRGKVHTKGKRKSTEDKHTKAEARRKREQNK